MKTMMNDGMRKVWTAGQYVTVDESMIKYMGRGRAVSFVQYMPAKPIKHGIKVYALCCAVPAAILAFEIYCGKEDGKDGLAVGVRERLIIDAGLSVKRGHVLFTDNFYTLVKLAKHMFEKYGWTICGTITPTDKSRGRMRISHS